jgi:fatty acid synthase
VIQKGSGKFEIVEGNAAVVSGSVRVPANVSNEIVTLEPPKLFVDDGLLELSSQDIYRELRLCGYEYQGLFRGLVCADSCGG